ncbi:MAG: GNAT family N-acetyltransferase [Actinomycetia bacterium]|jgi:RimJ/RimL family protein N-acetyltransferase|nr:GNAT family N-acetyltransferase [Actinomycetes bacterium]
MSDVVRLARREELPAVAELTVRAYLAEGTLAGDDDYLATLADATARAETAELYVAEEAGRLVGTVTVCPPGSAYAEIAGPGELEFRMLAVDPRDWGQGHAVRLLDTVADLARTRGCRRVVASVVDANAVAHRLYERCGFRRRPDRDWTPVPGVRLDVVELDVDAGSA